MVSCMILIYFSFLVSPRQVLCPLPRQYQHHQVCQLLQGSNEFYFSMYELKCLPEDPYCSK